MNEAPQIQALEQKMQTLISNEPGLFLVKIKISPGNNIKVFIDGDKGINIDKLVQYNRRLYKEIEEGNLFPGGDFSLEVSSPGLEEPLQLRRQYLKNIGRFAEVLLHEGQKIEGTLQQVLENEVVIVEEKKVNKKKELVQHSIPFEKIKSTKIQIKF
jgi:ribosome maturation factor RimP